MVPVVSSVSTREADAPVEFCDIATRCYSWSLRSSLRADDSGTPSLYRRGMSPAGPRDARLIHARVARLATVDVDGHPHIVPITFAIVDDRIVTVVDGKAKSTRHLKRLRNLAANPNVSLMVDHYDDDWSALWWIRVDGTATVIESGATFDAGVGALRDKYPQYRTDVSTDGPLIVIDVKRVVRWP